GRRSRYRRSRSRRCGDQRCLQLLEHADDSDPFPRGLQRVALAVHQLEEVASLQAERLFGRNLRAEDVTGPRLPRAIALGWLLRPLLIDGHLALELHVVEDDHLLLPYHA